jgi:hypothetical protein
MFFPRCRGLLLTAVFALVAAGAKPENPNAGLSAGLSATQIAEQMQSHDQARAQELKRYHTLRHYQVVYRGYSATVAASMAVEVSYDIASGKSFQIVSQSGPKFLVEKVLKRALDSEQDVFKERGSMALTPANYQFHLAGSEMLAGRPAYILDVEPKVPSKFLYRGKVWVDAADFAAVKMETQPAKSPSFWISRTLIHYRGAKTEGFWMPQEVRSETSVRVGGAAVMTIDFGTYQIDSNTPRFRGGD